MHSLRKYIRVVSAFLLINFLYATFMPTISFALTSGPTAPEATSFEPIDTTDMVNPISGDFVYNIPLLEVPGPSGGYPLALSYHPGIMPNEEASWVGLGWTLNPGAISRNVNGFADDQKKAPNTDRFFWEGGERSTYSVGVSYGVPGQAASVSAGLEFSQDTFEGFGVGNSVGAGAGGVGVNMGQDAYGNMHMSLGYGGGVGFNNSANSAMSIGGSIGLSYNGESIGGYASGGVSYSTKKGGSSAKEKGIKGASLLGASISSNGNGIKASTSVGGGTLRINNNTSGDISTSTSGFAVSIPVYPVPGLWLNLGYQHTRYWIDKLDNADVYGALYNPSIGNEFNNFEDVAFDTYDLPSDLGSNAFISPDASIYGSYMNYDDYSVNAQGVMGSIRPYNFKTLLFRQNRVEDDITYIKQYAHLTDHYRNDPFEFRFINDFSNKYLNSGGLFTSDGSPLKPDFESAELTGDNEANDNGILENHLAGSRHIEYLTNSQIVENDIKIREVGFIETQSTGFTRSELESQFGEYIGDQIGAFVITNESGVKYHFCLPAYSYREYQYSGVINSEVETFSSLKKPNAYAYTWFLTAITGPDFVDRGGVDGAANGVFDGEDWGYWVEFDHGKWTDTFDWRNPGEGTRLDLGNRNRVFSTGKKQVYYLDKVKTKTHTALFVKDVRNDAKGSLHVERSLDIQPSIPSTLADELAKLNSLSGLSAHDFKDAGFEPEDKNCSCEVRELAGGLGNWDYYSGTYKSKAASSLKLDKIVLVKNEYTSTLDKAVGNEFHQELNFNWIAQTNNLNECQDLISDKLIQHLPDNILDIHDGTGSIESEALRVIKMNSTTDPDEGALVPETVNSYNAELVESGASEIPLQGKLTLNSIEFNGRKGVEGMLPPITFDYEMDNPKAGYSEIKDNNGWQLIDSNADLEGGDLIKINVGSESAYAFVESKNGDSHTLKSLGSVALEEGFSSWTQTINPPYNKDFVDIWGLYKPDYVEYFAIKEKYNRNVSNKGVKSASAWSLRNIKAQTGANIQVEYEPDDYSKSILNNIHFPIHRLSATAAGKLKVIFEDQFWHSVDQTFAVNSYHQFLLHIESLMENEQRLRNLVVQIIGKEDNALILDWNAYPFMTDSHGQDLGFYEFEPQQDLEMIRGHIIAKGDYLKKGGGLRVKSIAVRGSLTNENTFTEYSYTNPENGLSSGSTSYEPNSLVFLENPENFSSESMEDNYMTAFNSGVNDVLKYSRNIPAPGVLYEFVTVKGGIIKNDIKTYLPSYSTYEYAIMDSEYIRSQQIDSSIGGGGSYDGIDYDAIKKHDRVIADYTSHVGSLKSVTLYDNNGSKISQTINEYLIDKTPGVSLDEKIDNYDNQIASLNHQGVIQETFMNQKIVKRASSAAYDLIGLITRNHSYPTIQIGQTTTNYKTGITSSTENLAFDFYSGAVTRTRSINGFGNAFDSETIPAYRAALEDESSAYAGMGLAIDGGKNMLTQTAANYTWKVDPSSGTKQALVAADIQTWNNKWKYRAVDGTWANVSMTSDAYPVWRKHKSYSFTAGASNLKVDQNDTDLDGLMHYDPQGFQDFHEWSALGTEPGTEWQKNSEITLYDRYSHVLEATDINGNYAATKMDNRQEKVLATVANATYDEFAYSGAEDWDGTTVLGGGVTWETGAILSKQNNNYDTHTGDKVLGLVSGNKGFAFKSKGLKVGRKYKVSVWSDKQGLHFYSKADQSTAQLVPGKRVRQSGSWYLHEVYVEPPSGITDFEVYCEATEQILLDDFRFHPIDAPMTAYVYNEYDELAFVLDNNNLYTEYQYDEMGRLESTYRESFKYGRKKVSEYSVHYSEEPTSNK